MEEQGSSSGASSKDSNESEQKITLNILSPSAGIPNKIAFQDISTSTTVGELKKMIYDVVPSKPSPQWQRLIYRGRALIQDGVTLKDIFTQEMINQSEALSLHLVLPPAAPGQTTALPISATVPDRSGNMLGAPSRGAGDEQSSNNQRNFNISTSEPSAIQDGQADTTNLHPQSGTPLQTLSSLPPFMQQAMRNYYDTLVHQAGGQLPLNGNPVFIRSPTLTQTQPYRQADLDPIMQQHHQQIAQQRQQLAQQQLQIAQQQIQMAQNQQQLIAAARLRGLHLNRGIDNQHPQTITPPQPLTHGSPIVAGNPPLSSLPANSRIVQENRGPNGEHWRMVIESTQTVTRPPHHHHHHAHNHQNQRPSSSTTTNNDHSTPSPVPSRTSSPQARGSPSIPSGFGIQPSGNLSNGQPQQSLLEHNLSSIETALAEGTAPHEPHFQTARRLLQRMVTQGEISADSETTLRSRIDHLSTQADQLRASLNSILMRVISEQPPVQRSTPLSPPPPVLPSPSSSIYVLSSPSGPYALLVSPSGMYTAPWHFPASVNITPNPTLNQHTNIISSTQPTNVTEETNPAQLPENPPQDVQAQRQQHEQQFNQQVNQARGLIRLLLPLGGHLWLLVRLFGFVYFFTGGGGYRRAVLLGLGAFLVFIAQTGLFRPFLQSVWEPLRRHIENLLPLATNDRPLLVGAAAGDNVNATEEPRAQRGNDMPTPQQAAERLLRERENRDGSIIRQNLRRLERAIALFVASLVPGVGERHIAARDAAEAARREEERVRREEEERARQEGEEKSRDQNVSDEIVQGEHTAEPSYSHSAEHTGERPAVEV